MMTRDQAEKIAHAVHAIRPDWDTPGIIAALSRSRDRADTWQVAIAAITAAADNTNRTPAVIPLAGKHWQTATTGTSPVISARTPRCQVYGHEGYPAHNCAGCRTEQLTGANP